jgi:hypothetical protein
MRALACLAAAVVFAAVAGSTATAAPAKFKVCSPTLTGPSASWSFSYNGQTVKFKGNKWLVGVGGAVSCGVATKAAPGLLKKWQKTALGGSFKYAAFTCSKTRVRSYSGTGYSSSGLGCVGADENHYFSLTMIAPHSVAELAFLLKR